MFNFPLKPFEEQIASGGGSTLTFSDILSKVQARDRHLVLILMAQTEGTASAGYKSYLNFNDDSGNNYGYEKVDCNAEVLTILRQDAESKGFIGNLCTSYSSYIKQKSITYILIANAFSGPSKKSYAAQTGWQRVANLTFGQWNNTDAIDKITLTCDSNFKKGTKAVLAVVDEDFLLARVDLDDDGLPVFDSLPNLAVDGIKGDYVCLAQCRTDFAGSSDPVLQEIDDDDTDANYFYKGAAGTDAVSSILSAANRRVGEVPGANAPANEFGIVISEHLMTWQTECYGYQVNISGFLETGTPEGKAQWSHSYWANKDQPSKLEYTPESGTKFAAGSTFDLYSIPKNLIARFKASSPVAGVYFEDLLKEYDVLSIRVLGRTNYNSSNQSLFMGINQLEGETDPAWRTSWSGATSSFTAGGILPGVPGGQSTPLDYYSGGLSMITSLEDRLSCGISAGGTMAVNRFAYEGFAGIFDMYGKIDTLYLKLQNGDLIENTIIEITGILGKNLQPRKRPIDQPNQKDLVLALDLTQVVGNTVTDKGPHHLIGTLKSLGTGESPYLIRGEMAFEGQGANGGVIDFGDLPLLDMGTDDFTIAFRSRGIDSNGWMLAKYIDSTKLGWRVQVSSENVYLGTGDGTFEAAAFTNVLEAGYTDVIITRQGAVCELYKNGKFFGSGTVRAGNLAAAIGFRIGNRSDPTENLQWTGGLRQVLIWKRKLTAEQILAFTNGARIAR